MNKMYLIITIVLIVCGAYFYGFNIADAKCKMHVAQENLMVSEQNQIENIQNKRMIDEKVYTTGTDDIRRILRTKYTIAE